jgi:hypothetical protein
LTSQTLGQVAVASFSANRLPATRRRFAFRALTGAFTVLVEALLYLILALGLEGGLSMLSAILRKLPKMRSKKVVWNVESIPRTSG